MQTGPVGKLLTVAVPPDFLNEVTNGQLSIKFDDPTTGAGDGYAIDFVKLLINAKSLPNGGLSGHVTDAGTGAPISGARLSAFGSITRTDASGFYSLTNVPDDARALLRRIFVTPANLRPDYEQKTLLVELHRLGGPLQDAAVAALCEELTATEARFSTTDLRLIYRQVGSA